MNKSLLALALGGLAIGVTEFTIMGMLPDVAKYFDVSIPKAGYLITSYALGVVIGAPLLIVGMRKYSSTKMLLGLMLLFTIFNALSVIAPSFEFLMLSRFISGLPHGAFFGVGSVVASKLARKGKEAQAVATMYSGLTVANLLGVPLGTYIGHHFSWRYTFLLIVIIGILTLVSLKLWMPEVKIKKQENQNNPWSDFVIFKDSKVWFMILIFSVAPGALFAWISYIAPLMTQVSGVQEQNMPYIMVLAGLGMFVGNLIGAKLTDRFSASKIVMIVLFLQILTMGTIYFTAQITWLSLVMTFITGVVSFALIPSLTLLLLKSVKSNSELLVASLGPACFNIANALGAYLGGVPIEKGYGYTSAEIVAIGMVILGIIIFSIYMKTNKNKVQLI